MKVEQKESLLLRKKSPIFIFFLQLHSIYHRPLKLLLICTLTRKYYFVIRIRKVKIQLNGLKTGRKAFRHLRRKIRPSELCILQTTIFHLRRISLRGTKKSQLKKARRRKASIARKKPKMCSYYGFFRAKLVFLRPS